MCISYPGWEQEEAEAEEEHLKYSRFDGTEEDRFEALKHEALMDILARKQAKFETGQEDTSPTVCILFSARSSK